MDSSRLSGTPLDGVYSTTITVPAMAARGTWVANEAAAVDNVGNRLFLLHPDLVARGFANSFEQVGIGDAAPPDIQSLSLSPASVDTSTCAQTITVTAHLTDDFSGVSAADVQFFNAAGQVAVASLFPWNLQSGIARDGIYLGILTMRQYSAPGTWYVDVATVSDNAGNSGMHVPSQLVARGLFWSFEQVGPGDTTAPVLQELSWTPTTINAAPAAQQITVTARVIDDLAGMGTPFSPPIVSFVSPSGQYLSLHLTQRIAGTSVDGTDSGVLTVPALSESRAWTASFAVWDQLTNLRNYNRDDLAARGLPSTFTNH